MDNLPMYVYISTITILRFSMHLYVEKRNKCQLRILCQNMYLYLQLLFYVVEGICVWNHRISVKCRENFAPEYVSTITILRFSMNLCVDIQNKCRM